MSVVERQCLQCGDALGAGAIEGFCQRCLAAVAFDTTSDTCSAAVGTGTSPKRRRGGYELIEEIGRGGMGVVYRARQIGLDREVAVKTLRQGPFADASEVTRFRREAAAAASLRHPNIVAVHEVGRDGDTLYIVSDFVRGVTLADHLTASPFSVREAAELLAKIADALHHAHQKGVIHRDLKPANVLVSEMDGVAVPTVIDFGIARAIGDASTGAVALTAHGQFVGTPEYMSPEQATGATDPDVHCDVYSLGVILYELLTGAPPFDFHKLGFSGLAEIQRVLREVDPPRLSSRVPDATRKRKLEGDLDWIVLKALEKDPARRYDSAVALAEDLERHLACLPVTARPPTIGYRFAKLARRRRGAMIAAAAIVLIAVAGTAGTIGALIRARRAEREATAAAAMARREAAVSAAISTFFNQDLLHSASPRGGGREMTVRAALERAAATLDGRFPDYPEVEAALRLTLGRTFRQLGEADRAETQLRRAVEVGRQALTPGDLTTLQSLHELGLTLSDQGRHSDALRTFEELIAADPERGQSEFGNRALQGRAMVFLREDRNAEALPLLQEVIARRLVLVPNDANLPRLRSLLGDAYLRMARSDEALAELTEAERSAERISGQD
jgi:tRNA A-37 threonylcarbamoyl transferase component Bud32